MKIMRISPAYRQAGNAECEVFLIIRLLNHYAIGSTIFITQPNGCGYRLSAFCLLSFCLQPQTSILYPQTFTLLQDWFVCLPQAEMACLNPFSSITYAKFFGKLVQGFIKGPEENVCQYSRCNQMDIDVA